MQGRVRSLAGALAALCIVSSVAVAQAGAPPSLWEFGADAGISINHQTGGSTTVFQFPVPLVRAGVFVTPALSIEPGIGFTRVSGGGAAVTNFNLVVGALYHFQTNRGMDQPYVRPFVDYVHTSVSGAGSSSQTGLGVGVGIKHSFTANHRIGGRGELNVAHYDTNPGTLSFGVLAGISIYTR